MYAAGKIPGGFIKREGRPSETAILTARLDRPAAAPALPQGLLQRGAGHHHGAQRRYGERPELLSIIGARRPCASPTSRSRGRSARPASAISTASSCSTPTDEQIGRQPARPDDRRHPRRRADGRGRRARADRRADARCGQVRPRRSASQPRAAGAADRRGRQARSANSSRRAADTVASTELRRLLGDRLREAINNPDKTAREDGPTRCSAEAVAALHRRRARGRAAPRRSKASTRPSTPS